VREYSKVVKGLILAGALLAAVGAGAAIGSLSSSGSGGTVLSSTTQSVEAYAAAAAAVPTNRVTGRGTVSLQLKGDTATVTLITTGLLDGSPHLAHIHGQGEGSCPTASSAHLHHGHLSISTGDAIQSYGPTLTSFTEWGSTSGAVPNNIDMNRYPASGNIHYTRTMTLPRLVADLIRDGNAVIVVHGIDYNRNHIYDFGALGVSDLDKTLPGEATAPALCGALRPSQGSPSPTARNQPGSASITYTASLKPETTSTASLALLASRRTAPTGQQLHRSLLFCEIGRA
jgi:hypothetical protein